jgi:hypothetical protein
MPDTAVFDHATIPRFPLLKVYHRQKMLSIEKTQYVVFLYRKNTISCGWYAPSADEAFSADC